MPRPPTTTVFTPEHEVRIRRCAEVLRSAVEAVDSADQALGQAIYEAVSGGHLSEQAAARHAGLSRATARRYRLGKGDRGAGRDLEAGWNRARERRAGDLPTRRWSWSQWRDPPEAPDGPSPE